MLSSMVFKLVSLVVSPARADVHQQTLAGLASDLFRTTQALTSQAWSHHAQSRTPVARLGLQASRPNVHGRAFTRSKSEGAQTSSAPKSKPVTESARLALSFLRTATRTTATLSLLSLPSSHLEPKNPDCCTQVSKSLRLRQRCGHTFDMRYYRPRAALAPRAQSRTWSAPHRHPHYGAV